MAFPIKMNGNKWDLELFLIVRLAVIRHIISKIRSYSFYGGSSEAEINLFTFYFLSHLFNILINTHLSIRIQQILHPTTLGSISV